MNRYVILGPVDTLDGEQLYWSNNDGWVNLGSADIFNSMQGNLPDEGMLWACADERHGIPCPQPCNVCLNECREMSRLITRKDEPQFDVTLIIRLSTRIEFVRGSGLDDNTEITKSDAIDNAIGSLPQSFLDDLADGFGGEFIPAMPIDGEATLVEYE